MEIESATHNVLLHVDLAVAVAICDLEHAPHGLLGQMLVLALPPLPKIQDPIAVGVQLMVILRLALPDCDNAALLEIGEAVIAEIGCKITRWNVVGPLGVQVGRLAISDRTPGTVRSLSVGPE